MMPISACVSLIRLIAWHNKLSGFQASSASGVLSFGLMTGKSATAGMPSDLVSFIILDKS